MEYMSFRLLHWDRRKDRNKNDMKNTDLAIIFDLDGTLLRDVPAIFGTGY